VTGAVPERPDVLAGARLLYEGSPIPMWLVDRDTLRFLDVNDAAVRRYGYTREEFLAMTIADLRGPEDAVALREAVDRDEPGPRTSGRWRHRRRDGSLAEVEIWSEPLEREGRRVLLVLALDVTERDEAEREVARRNEELTALHETALRLLERIDLDGVLETIVARATELLGARDGYLALVDEAGEALVPRLATDGVADPDLRLAPGQGVAGLAWAERRAVTVSGYRTWEGRVRAHDARAPDAAAAVPLFVGDEVVGVLGVGLRGDGRLFGEAELALLERFGRLASLALAQARLYDEVRRELAARRSLAALVEASGELIALAAPGGRLRFLNAAGRRLLGVAGEAELEALDVSQLVAPQDRAAVAAALAEGRAWRGETELRAGDGAATAVELSTFPVVDPGSGEPLGIALVGRDVGERRDLEAQLRHAQKLEALGRLAGGVAHDFNNLLTAIEGYGELAAAQLPPEHPARRELAEVRNAASRAAALTAQLLAFGRRQELRFEVVDLDAAVARCEGLLRRLIGEDVEIVTELAAGTPAVRVDPVQLEQAIVNLAINARDAMPHGGRLTIRTGAAEHAGAGLFATVSVADTGVGMDESTLARAFEPFFTTKQPGQGTGLGLSTVHGIVEQSGGHVDVTSAPGKGTVITLSLPGVERPASPAAAPPAAAPAAGPGATVLVVEDDDAVRGLVRELLEARGHAVHEASSPAEAVERAEALPALDVLVTDVVMPGGRGPELAARLRERRPDLGVLFMSGYVEGGEVPGDLLTRALAKPFTAAELAAAIGELLEARRG
jgi:PAS domain S-box-containing protein